MKSMANPESVLKKTIELPYTWAMGEPTAKFLEGLRNKKIFGTKCPKCKRVLVPARRFCPRCFVNTKEWIQVSDQGTLRTYTIVYYSYPGQVKPPPYAIGVVDLEGADTGFSHYVGGVDLSDPAKAAGKIRVGSKYRAVWSRKREGNIFDIEYFTLL